MCHKIERLKEYESKKIIFNTITSMGEVNYSIGRSQVVPISHRKKRNDVEKCVPKRCHLADSMTGRMTEKFTVYWFNTSWGIEPRFLLDHPSLLVLATFQGYANDSVTDKIRKTTSQDLCLFPGN